MNDNLLQQQIESYFDGTMPEGERQLFIADPLIAKEVALQEGIGNAIAEDDVFLLENILIEEGKKYSHNHDLPGKETKVVSFFRRYRAIAAGLAFLAIAFLVLQLFTSQPADPWATYFEKYPMYLNSRSDNPQDIGFNTAIYAYGTDDFQTAWSQFLTLSAAEPENMGVLFYAAMSALQLDKIPDAVAGFKIVANQGDSIYAAPAEWYLALSFFKSGDYINARKVLKNIVSNGGDFMPKAVLLLKDIPN